MKSKFLLTALAGTAFIVFYALIKSPEGRLKLSAGSRVPMVSLGNSHGLVLAPDGSIWSWGGQDRGWPVLGLGQKESTDKLIQIGSETAWISVSAGADHNLALKADGTMWAWGANYRGQLGNGTRGVKWNGTPTEQNRPVHTAPGNDWVQVQAGSVTSYALKRDGSLWAWGLNNFCQLGIGSWADSPTPVRVGTATNWTKIRAGGVSAAGIQSDGSLWIWGGSPKLGNTASQNPENLQVPTRFTSETNWVDVAVAFNLWLAIKADGTLWAWGRTANIYTGDPADGCEKPNRVGHDSDWQSVWSSGGGYHHLLRKKDGTYWVLDALDSNQGVTTPTLKRIDFPANIVAADSGGGACAVITSDGEVWSCGTVLGEHGAKYRFLRFLERQCWRFGWKVQLWTMANQERMVREQPWQVRNLGSKE